MTPRVADLRYGDPDVAARARPPLMRDANPLLADRVDSTTWYTGAGIVEDVNDLIADFESGSWIDAGIGGLAASMDLLAVCTDPLGALASWGVAWLIEHVKPLSDALDWLAGDPDQITAYAQTWRKISSAVASCASSFPPHPAGWAGAAADAYRSSALDEVHALEGMARAAGGIALIVEGGGLLVALVRGLVRDLIAEFVSVLAVRLPEWLAEEACTLGVATPWVAAQVSALVGKWVAKVARLLHGLAASIRKLLPALRRLGELIGSLKAVLRDLHRSPAPAGPPVYPPDPVRPPRGLGADGPVLAGSHDIPGSPRTVDAVTATTPDRPASPDFNNTSVLAPDDGARAIDRPKGNHRNPGGEVAYRDLTPKARQLARALDDGPVNIRPGEVSASHLAELQRYHDVEVAVVQNPAGDLKLILGEERRTVIPRELRDQGYQFTVHTHPENGFPGERPDGANSMSKDLDNKRTPHVEVVISQTGHATYFQYRGGERAEIIYPPAGAEFLPGGPIGRGGFIGRVPGL